MYIYIYIIPDQTFFHRNINETFIYFLGCTTVFSFLFFQTTVSFAFRFNELMHGYLINKKKKKENNFSVCETKNLCY